MREQPQLRTALACALIWLIGGCPTALASPLDLYGFGGRTSAMSGAGLVTTNDYDATLLNPAGLGATRQKRLSFGYLYGDLNLNIDGVLRDVDPASGVIIGGIIPINFGGAWRDRVTLGLGFYIPTESLAHNKAPFPGQPQFALLEQRSQILSANIGLGIKLSDDWLVGIGVSALATLTGNIDIVADDLGRFNSTSAQNLITKAAPMIGAQWTPASVPTLVVGLGIRGKTSSGYDLVVKTDLGSIVPIELPEMRIAGTPQFEPLSANAEAAYTMAMPSPHATLRGIVAVAWQQWSKYPLPTENPVAGMDPQQAPGFHDTIVPRLGLEYTRGNRRLSITPRLGVAYLASPAPEMRGQQSLLDNHRVVSSAGVGAQIDAGHNLITIDAWFQAHTLLSRTHTKDAALQPAGAMPAFASIDTGGRILAGGLSVGVGL